MTMVDDDGNEIVVVRRIGGPLNGQITMRVPAIPIKDTDIRWPFPYELDFTDEPLLPLPVGKRGRYYKTGESRITNEEIKTMTHVLRGVEYTWREGD